MSQQNRKEQGTFNLKEAAAYAGVSLPTLTAWANRAGFPAFKSGRRWVIPCRAFAAWLEDQAKNRVQL